MNASKQVSFSDSSTLILTPRLGKQERSKLWHSPGEILAFKSQWSKTIREVQKLDATFANATDASNYMGLESYLSKAISKHCEERRREYIHSVVAGQHSHSCHEDFAEFAVGKSKSAVERSHAIGVFYASRIFSSERPKTAAREIIPNKGTSKSIYLKPETTLLKRHTFPETNCKKDHSHTQMTQFFTPGKTNKTATARCA